MEIYVHFFYQHSNVAITKNTDVKQFCMYYFGSPQVDLIQSIGESAALGTAGCVLWGSSYDFNDKVVFLLSSLL